MINITGCCPITIQHTAVWLILIDRVQPSFIASVGRQQVCDVRYEHVRGASLGRVGGAAGAPMQADAMMNSIT